TGKNPYYEATLDNYVNIPQNDPVNCKNATLEAIDRMNGGSRTQEYFKEEGLRFLADNPNATLDQYFEHFGFDIRNPYDWTYQQIGQGMKLGNPTVIDQNIRGGHTLTIVKIRQWTPTGNVKVWFGDPQLGTWKANWNIIGSPSFNRGAYLFWLKK
ncbi:MAG: hypothetical protein M0P54_11455, partial [Bacteroidales bacterium]|nr:hypothetical protein [Bacteroidales bacterium]